MADPAGALYWPDEGVLAVADLHLEKGSSFARRGVLLPPYDTAATLARLCAADRALCAALRDRAGRQLPRRRRAGAPRRRRPHPACARCKRGRDWIWITGNHDPEPAENIGGQFGGALAIGALTFRHMPSGARGRNRRPSASGRAGVASRPRGEPPLLRRRWRADGDAGVRRLCRRPQYARRAPSPTCSARWPSPRICWASSGSMPFGAKHCLPD